MGLGGVAMAAAGTWVQQPVLGAVGLTAAAMVAGLFPARRPATGSERRDDDARQAREAADRRHAEQWDNAELSAHHDVIVRFDALFAAATAVDPDSNRLESGLPTHNAALKARLKRADRFASRTRAAVLIDGETGTGKTELARRIHRVREDAGLVTGSFIPVNCAVFRGDVNLTTLVGHLAGSYTDAKSARAGLLARARGGTLCFDEVAELTLDQQAQLLTILHTKRYRPHGGDDEVETDACFVFATNADLRALVAAGLFRADLLARIDTFQVTLPPLRDRTEDLPALIEFELGLARDELGPKDFHPDAYARWLDFVRRYPWPDNFRGVAKAMERLTVLADEIITLEAVEEEIALLEALWAGRGAGDGLEGVVGAEVLGEMIPVERLVLAHTVRTCRTSTSMGDASRQLYGVSDSTRLKRYLEKYGLSYETLRV